MSASITLLRTARPEPKLDFTPWQKIEGTNPRTVTMVNYQSPDGRKIAGVWLCTPGKWEIDYDRWEYCHFQEGYSVITLKDRAPIHLKAGDIFVLEPGAKGTWEVLETVRKHFIFVS